MYCKYKTQTIDLKEIIVINIRGSLNVLMRDAPHSWKRGRIVASRKCCLNNLRYWTELWKLLYFYSASVQNIIIYYLLYNYALHFRTLMFQGCSGMFHWHWLILNIPISNKHNWNAVNSKTHLV